MKAILVRYIPQTEHKPARLKATDCDSNSVTISRDAFDSYAEAECGAARALCEKMKWGGRLVSGGLGKLGAVFVFDPAVSPSLPLTIES